MRRRLTRPSSPRFLPGMGDLLLGRAAAAAVAVRLFFPGPHSLSPSWCVALAAAYLPIPFCSDWICNRVLAAFRLASGWISGSCSLLTTLWVLAVPISVQLSSGLRSSCWSPDVLGCCIAFGHTVLQAAPFLRPQEKMAFAPLSDLPLGRAHCGVCVRVVRLWDYCGNKEDEPPLHVDMVLVDEKGNRMYAEIPGAEAEKFKLLIKEGQVYVIRKFIVSGGKPAYKPFPNSQMIRFTPWTTVQESDEGGSKIPKYVYNLVGFEELPSRAGQVECVLDVIGVIVGVSEIAHVHLPSTSGTTSKRVISLKDLRNNKVNLVLWGNRAISFDAETVHSIGQQSPVVAVFVGLLVKSYKSEVTLSGGSACKWYINEEISEIEEYFDRVYDQHDKVQWISAGEQQFRALERQQNLEEKTLLQLRDIDPWEFESSGYHCTVTIVRISDKQPWWFASCTKCHRASVVHGSQYKCSGGCPCTTAEPKYRLSVIGTDGTATAEFVLFGRVARQIIGKPVVALIRSSSKNHIGYASDTEHILPEIAALVSQKFTFSVSVTQKSLSQRNVSFQVNGIVALYGKQLSTQISHLGAMVILCWQIDMLIMITIQMQACRKKLALVIWLLFLARRKQDQRQEAAMRTNIALRF